MTEKYDPYENAITERINGVLKQGFGIERKIKDFKIKKKLIKNAINIYNTKRAHFSNHMLIPIQMHEQNKLKRKQYKTKNLNNEIIVQVNIIYVV
jgi:putative transposase